MKKVFLLLVLFVFVSCATSKKSSNYDSVFGKKYSPQKDIVDTLRDVANLGKDDFAFILEKMKNITRSYKGLQNKLSKLEKRMDHLIASKSLENSKEVRSGMQILEEDLSSDDLKIDEEPTEDKNIDIQEIVKKTDVAEEAEKTNSKIENQNNFIEAKKLYSEKSWQSAISKFQDYNDQNPKGLYVIEATFYIGESFRHLEMLPEARVFYEEVVKSYPSSSWALKAKQYLKK